ncbi:MAG: Crp/Fnr family transcriptional regulator [Bacteroidota bacterium]
MNPFLQYINNFTTLSAESQNALSAIVAQLELPKGETLIRQDVICEHAYFIEKGLARTYYYKDGRAVTDWLGAEGDVVVSIVSFLMRQPDRRNVELLENSIVWKIPFYELEILYAKHHDIERLGRLLMSHGLVMLQQRFDDLHFATASERYQKLLKTKPSLLQRVPLGMIASYLGITQETLSRIRAQA